MKNRNRKLLFGLLALLLCGSAVAHDSGPYAGYPQGNLAVGATIWGSSQGLSGWSGTLTLGNAYRYTPGFVTVAVPIPPEHRHGPSCHHVSHHVHQYAHQRNHGNGHKQNRGHGHDHHGRQ